MKKVIITYGTFDMFHIGHLKLLERLKKYGEYLIVAVSTDEFNEEKGKQTIISYEQRAEIVKAIKYVDLVIPEYTWEQKIDDIKQYNVNIFAMGDDWKGKFDYLQNFCQVLYLERTTNISSTHLKEILQKTENMDVNDIKYTFEVLRQISS
jgi:glycerol-3-phosphate cytidylyltransferase